MQIQPRISESGERAEKEASHLADELVSHHSTPVPTPAERVAAGSMILRQDTNPLYGPVSHNHQPIGRWAEIREDAASAIFPNRSEYICQLANTPVDALEAATLWFGLMGWDLAARHLMHYLTGGGQSLSVPLGEILETDSGVRERIATRIRRDGDQSGFTMYQEDYDEMDVRNALGTIDLVEYEVDRSTDLIHVWFIDRYEWHPVGYGYTSYPGDSERPTNCLHAAGVEAKLWGAADYWMVGDATVPLDLITDESASDE